VFCKHTLPLHNTQQRHAFWKTGKGEDFKKFCMKLFTIGISFALFTLSFHSCGQTSKDMRTRILEDIKQRAAGREEFYNDTASLRAYAEVYGDSVLIQIDNFLKDSSNTKSLNSFKNDIQKYEIQDQKSQVGWLNDFEAIFSDSEKKELSVIMENIFRQTFKQVVVVSIEKASVSNGNFDQFIDSILNGRNKDIAKGKIVVFGVCAGMQKARISVCEELKRKLPDEQSNKIVNDIVLPAFTNKDYFEGTKRGLLKTIEMLK
jgi:uncharacterized protein